MSPPMCYGAAMKKVIHSDRAPAAIGPYSQAIEANGTVYLSGQIALDPRTGALVNGSVKEEAERVLANLGAVLEAAGLGYANVVKTTVFLVDMADYAAVNEVYGRFFTEAKPPARAAVAVAALPRGVRVEIDAIAVR